MCRTLVFIGGAAGLSVILWSIAASLVRSEQETCRHCGRTMQEVHRHTGDVLSIHYECECGSRTYCRLSPGGDEIRFTPPPRGKSQISPELDQPE